MKGICVFIALFFQPLCIFENTRKFQNLDISTQNSIHRVHLLFVLTQHTYVSPGNRLPFIFWALLSPSVCSLMMNFNQGAPSFPEEDG